MNLNYRWVAANVLVTLLVVQQSAYAHKKGNHAGDWTANQTIKVCVDTPPGDQANQDAMNAAVTGAMTRWNASKAGFKGGVTLELATENCDVQIKWATKATSWGSVKPDKNPVPVQIEPIGDLTAKGVERVLMHELGHVKGAGHSADSVVMKWNYPSATNDKAAKKEDWNKEGNPEAPNADDIALNKLLHAKVNAEESSKSVGDSTATLGTGWVYDYTLQSLEGPNYVDPVTRFILQLDPGVNATDFNVTSSPPGWLHEFVPAEPPDRTGGEGKPTETEEGLMSAALIFFTLDPGLGVFPGETAAFQVTSPLGPTHRRAYTNSPNFDSDEFILDVPTNIVGACCAVAGQCSQVTEGECQALGKSFTYRGDGTPCGPDNTCIPALSEWGVAVMAMLVLTAGTIVVMRRRAAVA